MRGSWSELRGGGFQKGAEVQLGMVMAQLGFNAAEEACQFSAQCLAFLDPASCPGDEARAPTHAEQTKRPPA